MTLWSLHFDVMHHDIAIFRKYMPILKPSTVKETKFMKFRTFYELYSQYKKLAVELIEDSEFHKFSPFYCRWF